MGTEALERARKSFAEGTWLDAFESFARIDRHEGLGAPDLERLAQAAYMLGRDDDYVEGLERAHQVHLGDGEISRAVRCAVWIGHSFLFRGELARATGWFARGGRLLEEWGGDCVERGYLLIPVWLEQLASADHAGGYATADEAAQIGERFGDADLVWLARHDQGRALVLQGRVREGLRVVDEALVVATAGALSPIVTGIVFCNTISFCRDVYELRHVREWTEALTAWCERQPEMVAHNGLCFVHRAEIKLLGGDWTAALEEARSSSDRFTRGVLNRIARGRAFYIQGETHRLRGEFAAAEQAYRDANDAGHEPQPGLALLRLSQGDTNGAVATIRRVTSETTDSLRRAELLAAFVDIMLAGDEVDLARAGSRELDEISQEWGTEVLAAMSARARATVALRDGAASGALVAAREALRIWLGLDAPYEAARVRLVVAAACETLGDIDTAGLERAAGSAVLENLGARERGAYTSTGTLPARAGEMHGLTRRELEVLRIVAAGRSNREIAAELVISERTVARHLQNIFLKLDVSSRTEAAAFVFTQGLM